MEGFGMTERCGILWKVPEGSGMTRATRGSPEGSIIGATTLLWCSRRLPNRAIRIGEGNLVLVGLLGGDSYLESFQIMGGCHGRFWTSERTLLGSPEGSTKV